VGAKDGKLFTSVSSSHFKQGLDLEKEPLPEVDIHFFSLKFIRCSCSSIFFFFWPSISLVVLVLFFIRYLMEMRKQQMRNIIRTKIAQKSLPFSKKLIIPLFLL
jgi:hypothetical protein